MDKFKKENLEELISKSFSVAQVLKLLNDKLTGGNYLRLKRKIEEFDLDISHFTGQAHNKGKNFKSFAKEIPLELVLVEKSTYVNGNSLKKKLYKFGIKRPICEECGQDENWRGKKFSLILDHINGIHDDNRIENLRILCPNCNACQPTHCIGPKIYKTKVKEEKPKLIKFKYKKVIEYIPKSDFCECGNTKRVKSKTCKKCQYEKQERIKFKDRPTLDVLENKIKTKGYCATGREYGVSDNTIKKWIEKFKILNETN